MFGDTNSTAQCNMHQPNKLTCGASPHCRYHAVLFPVTSFVCEVLPEGQRESSRTELFYEDLDRLSPDDVARISEWITEKVDGFSAKLKPEAKDAELEVGLLCCLLHLTDACDVCEQVYTAPRNVTGCHVPGLVVPWLQEEEEGIGDVDLFTLVDDGKRLAVNAKWLGHLADRQLGEDGHPRKVRLPCLWCLTSWYLTV